MLMLMAELIIGGPGVWTDVDKKKVTSCIMFAVSRWNMTEEMGFTELSLTIYKEHLSNTHPAVQYHTAWMLCNYITRDPSRYCPMVARDISLDYLDTWIHNDQYYTEARTLLHKVIDQCNNHK